LGQGNLEEIEVVGSQYENVKERSSSVLKELERKLA
jgi:hypothetical protein